MQKIILACFLLSATQSHSQTLSPFAINMGGGSKVIKPDFIVDWSIGESTSVETYFGDDPRGNMYVGRYWNVTSGVLQPFDNTHIIINPLIPSWTIYEIHFYPVPTRDVVTIDVRSAITGRVSIQLLDLNGKTLQIKEFSHSSNNEKYTWDLSKRTSGIYFFRIVLTSPQGEILKQGTFKIEKIN